MMIEQASNVRMNNVILSWKKQDRSAGGRGRSISMFAAAAAGVESKF